VLLNNVGLEKRLGVLQRRTYLSVKKTYCMFKSAAARSCERCPWVV
jgi:hypothetical protein